MIWNCWENYCKENRGSRIVPWGVPASTNYSALYYKENPKTVWVVFLEYQEFSSLCKRPSCHTLSDAFGTTKKNTSSCDGLWSES